jgi:hypothetical protein
MRTRKRISTRNSHRMLDIDTKRKASGRAMWLLVLAAGCIVLGAVLFAGISHVPRIVTVPEEVRSIGAMALRVMGFGAILRAGRALHAHSGP